MLRIAVQAKGRLYDETMSFLGESDIKLSAMKRSLLVQSSNFPLEVLFLRDDDTAAAVAGLEVIKEVDPDTGVTSYTKKYKITNKLGALDSVAKHLGMFNGTFGAPKDEAKEDGLSQSLRELAEEMESDD